MSFGIGSWGGVPVRVHWSLLIIALLLAVSLSDTWLPALTAHKYSSGSYWGAGIVTTLLFFISILLHELAHVGASKSYGIPVHRITLWLFGGISERYEDSPNARAEFVIAVVGPATSALLGLLFWGIKRVIESTSSADSALLLAASSEWLAYINFGLAVFNMLPAFPLDGGRALRAAIWSVTGSKTSATETAARVGQVFGFVLVGLGFYFLFMARVLDGLWFLMLGWILVTVAQAELDAVLMEQEVAGVLVRDVMSHDPVCVPPDLTLTNFLNQIVMHNRHTAYPVTDPNGYLLGYISLNHVRGIPIEHRGTITVGEAMTSRELTPTAHGDLPLLTATQRMTELGQSRLVVIAPATELPANVRVVGMLSATDILRSLEWSDVIRSRLGALPIPAGIDGHMLPHAHGHRHHRQRLGHRQGSQQQQQQQSYDLAATTTSPQGHYITLPAEPMSPQDQQHPHHTHSQSQAEKDGVATSSAPASQQPQQQQPQPSSGVAGSGPRAAPNYGALVVWI